MPALKVDSIRTLAQATLDVLDLWQPSKARQENPHAHLAFAGALHRHPGPWDREVRVPGLKSTKTWEPRIDFVVGTEDGNHQTLIEVAIRQQGQGVGYLLPPRAGYFTKTVRKLISYDHENTTHMRYLVLIDRSGRPRPAHEIFEAWLRWQVPKIGKRGAGRRWESPRSKFRLVYCSRQGVESKMIRPYRVQT